MSRRTQHLALVAILVVLLGGAAWALRTSGQPPRTGPTHSSPGAASSATGVASPAPTATVSPAASASPTEAPARPSSAAQIPAAIVGPASRVVFIGDSFTAGAGAATPESRWTTLLATRQKWSETNLAHPQSGYVQTGTTGECTPSTCPAFPDVVSEAVAVKPALVVIAGGANDLGHDKSKVTEAVTRTVGGIRSAAPKAQVVVVNPWWDLRPKDPKLADYTQAIRAAAIAAGAIWADTGQPLLGGPGLLQADGWQATDQGHAALAASVTRALEGAGIIAR